MHTTQHSFDCNIIILYYCNRALFISRRAGFDVFFYNNSLAWMFIINKTHGDMAFGWKSSVNKRLPPTIFSQAPSAHCSRYKGQDAACPPITLGDRGSVKDEGKQPRARTRWTTQDESCVVCFLLTSFGPLK